MRIKVLPSNIANVIAAGEVVERPASVVKELMENAVDAGASEVKVIIQDAGRTLIQVIDNGCGMSPDEAVLCFERHATSKIAEAGDLMNIHTFGFRGEALASIAAVAEVCLKTRREEDEVGCQVDFADSQLMSTIETACPVGSNFIVRNLFYNVPARRKFLKSDNAEFRRIVEEFEKVALTREDVAFSLSHNGREIRVLRPAKSMKFRIQDMIGGNVVSKLVDIHADTSVAEINGFVGRPETAKKGLDNQFFFVNGRYFQSPYLRKAIMNAYQNLIPEGVAPTYFIYLDVNPATIDVNVNPTKVQIKFEDDNLLFSVLYAAVKEALGRQSFGDSIDFDREGMTELPALGASFSEYRPVSAPQVDFDESFNPFENDGFPSEESPFPNFVGGDTSEMPGNGIPVEAETGPVRHGQAAYGAYVDKKDDYGKLFEDTLSPMKTSLVLQGRYIVTNSRSGLMMINVSRAVERILYDRFITAFSKREQLCQQALFPVSVHVGPENVPLFENYAQTLQTLGFDIVPFGSDTVVVNGVPAGFSVQSGAVESMVGDLILILSENQSALEEIMTANLASKFAKLGSLNCEYISNSEQAKTLMDELFASSNPEYTQSGRRISIVITIDEIEKKF